MRIAPKRGKLGSEFGRAGEQMTQKWGARGVPDLFEREAQLTHVRPPPRILDMHMRKWEANLENNLSIRKDPGGRVKMAGALMASGQNRYEEAKQTEVTVQSEQFSKVRSSFID